MSAAEREPFHFGCVANLGQCCARPVPCTAFNPLLPRPRRGLPLHASRPTDSRLRRPKSPWRHGRSVGRVTFRRAVFANLSVARDSTRLGRRVKYLCSVAIFIPTLKKMPPVCRGRMIRRVTRDSFGYPAADSVEMLAMLSRRISVCRCERKRL